MSTEKPLSHFKSEEERKILKEKREREARRVTSNEYPFPSYVPSAPSVATESKTVKAFFLKNLRRNVSGVDFNFEAGQIVSVSEEFMRDSNVALLCDEIKRPSNVPEEYDYGFRFSNPTAEIYIKPFSDTATMPTCGELHKFEGDGNQKFKTINGKVVPVAPIFFVDHYRILEGKGLWHRFLEPNQIYGVGVKETILKLLNGIAAEINLKMLNLTVVRFY